MAARIALTELAQEAWKPFLSPGSIAVDATAGNGNDTCFLAHQVGNSGKVIAIDIQKRALEQTTASLKQSGLLDRVTLLEGNHADLAKLIRTTTKDGIDLICFNLGYLPGGDHEIRSSASSTSRALGQSLDLLNPTGALSVIAYRGHPGGMDEAAVVEDFAASLPHPWGCQQHRPTGSNERPGPVWWLFSRKAV